VSTVVIAGAGLAGSRCAETLRARGFSGRIVLVGEEDLPPYERPALSKEFLAGSKRIEDLTLRPTSFWEEHGIELLLGRRVVGVRSGVAALSDGRKLSWDRFVVATGARARRLPFHAPDGVHLLRSVTDAAALRLRLRPAARLVVVGGGFVGAEVASTARDLGVDVAMLEAEATPFLRLLGREVGELLASRYRAAGVALRTVAQAAGFRTGSDGRVWAVQLTDGTELECDVVLVAVGAEPVRELVDLAPNGIVVCGDAAGGAGHWTSAASSGAEAACRLLGVEAAPPQPSYFWSDQFGLRVQLVGDPRSATTVDVERADNRFVALYRDADGTLVAGLAANRPDQIALLRRQLALAA
jgi:3-phenylpropionate/trans-cinnamate dioxygenase ferredoxin reductase component